MKQVGQDYAVITAAGALKLTTPDRDLAISRAREWSADFPGIHVQIVERFEQKRTVWRERMPQLVEGGR